MAQKYNAPNTTPSTVEGSGSSQMNTFFWQRKALVEAKKDMYFTPMADTKSTQKNKSKCHMAVLFRTPRAVSWCNKKIIF